MNGTDYQAIVDSLTMLNKNRNEFIGLFCLGLLAMATNPLIMWTIWRQKSVHSGCFILIAELALADFLIGAAFTITAIKRFIRVEAFLGEIITQLQCSFEMAPNYFSESASLILALAIGFERLIAAAMPVKFITKQWNIALAVSIIAWLTPTLDCISMLAVMISSPSKIINFCTSGTAVTKGFDAVQQVEKNCMAAAIIVTYALALSTITVQLRVARRKNQRSVAVMKKNLQLKMVRLMIAIAMMYLILQMAPRIGLIIIAPLPQETRLTVGPILRMMMALNSGIHFFIYLSTSTDFRAAFLISFGIKKSSYGGSSVVRSMRTNR